MIFVKTDENASKLIIYKASIVWLDLENLIGIIMCVFYEHKYVLN